MQAASTPQATGLEQSGVASSAGASLMEVSAFMTAHLKEQRDHDEKVRKDMEAQIKEAEAKLEAKLEAQKQEAETQRKEADAQRRAMETKIEALHNDAMEARVRDAQLQLEAQRQEADAKLEKQREEAETHKRDQQITALQARLEALHTAKLLADEELFVLEDAIVDALEAPDDDGRVARMVALSVRMAADAAFSRQLRRKFIQ